MHVMPQDTAYNIQYVTDTNGTPIFVQIPFPQWEIIRAKLLHEEQEALQQEQPDVIEKDGIFMVKAEPLEDLMQVVQTERELRITHVLGRGVESTLTPLFTLA